MSDEDKKKIISEPPPPTDEIDGEWGADDRAAETVGKSQPAPPTSRAAEASTPPQVKAATAVEADGDDDDDEDDEDEDEDEDEAATDSDEDEDEDEDDQDEEEEEEEEDAATGSAPAAPATDWLPDWAPFAVLALLVSVSVLVGLGLVGGGSSAGDETSEKAADPTPATVNAKPSAHP